MQMGKKVFVIYPGRFHPFHTGHKSVYNYLSTKFGGNDVYVTTTGVIKLPKSPFSFDEKKEMMMATGIPANKILNVKNNYNLKSVSNQIPINIERDSIIFAVSQKDMAEDPRFKRFVKKDGSLSYLQPMPRNESKLEPAINRGYFSTLTPEQQKLFIIDLFGSYNSKIHRILNNKLGNTSGKLTEKQKKLLKKLIVGILKEDEAKVKSATHKANLALVVQRQAELDDAEEKYDVANEKYTAATTPEEKAAADISLKNAKKVVDSKKSMYDAAKHQAST